MRGGGHLSEARRSMQLSLSMAGGMFEYMHKHGMPDGCGGAAPAEAAEAEGDWPLYSYKLTSKFAAKQDVSMDDQARDVSTAYHAQIEIAAHADAVDALDEEVAKEIKEARAAIKAWQDDVASAESDFRSESSDFASKKKAQEEAYKQQINYAPLAHAQAVQDWEDAHAATVAAWRQSVLDYRIATDEARLRRVDEVAVLEAERAVALVARRDANTAAYEKRQEDDEKLEQEMWDAKIALKVEQSRGLKEDLDALRADPVDPDFEAVLDGIREDYARQIEELGESPLDIEKPVPNPNTFAQQSTFMGGYQTSLDVPPRAPARPVPAPDATLYIGPTPVLRDAGPHPGDPSRPRLLELREAVHNIGFLLAHTDLMDAGLKQHIGYLLIVNDFDAAAKATAMRDDLGAKLAEFAKREAKNFLFLKQNTAMVIARICKEELDEYHDDSAKCVAVRHTFDTDVSHTQRKPLVATVANINMRMQCNGATGPNGRVVNTDKVGRPVEAPSRLDRMVAAGINMDVHFPGNKVGTYSGIAGFTNMSYRPTTAPGQIAYARPMAAKPLRSQYAQTGRVGTSYSKTRGGVHTKPKWGNSPRSPLQTDYAGHGDYTGPVQFTTTAKGIAIRDPAKACAVSSSSDHHLLYGNVKRKLTGTRGVASTYKSPAMYGSSVVGAYLPPLAEDEDRPSEADKPKADKPSSSGFGSGEDKPVEAADKPEADKPEADKPEPEPNPEDDGLWHESSTMPSNHVRIAKSTAAKSAETEGTHERGEEWQPSEAATIADTESPQAKYKAAVAAGKGDK